MRKVHAGIIKIRCFYVNKDFVYSSSAYFSNRMNFEINPKEYLTIIKEKWESLQQTPKVFAYNLNVSKSKILAGECGFYLELNPERTALRRAPQQITSLRPMFDESKFNFKKVNPQERMLDIQFADQMVVSMIINKSPLTKYHTLICPNVDMGYPQLITAQALQFCIEFMYQLEETFRIGYNSPGALASVNHLHLHLMHINLDLYIDRAKLTPLKYDYVYRLSSTMPTEAICFVICKSNSNTKKSLVVNTIYNFVQWLCSENLPHNIFMTKSREDEHTKSSVKIFVFVREKHCVIKDVTAFNIGFCELSGYIPVGSNELYENLTEEAIISKISTETGNIYEKIYKYFHNKNSIC